MDRLDRKILELLQQEGRLSYAELARRVHLSPTPCMERVRRLEATEDGLQFTWLAEGLPLVFPEEAQLGAKLLNLGLGLAFAPVSRARSM